VTARRINGSTFSRQRGARIAGLLAAFALLCAFAPAALGDGDPASDVLITQRYFVPADAGATRQQEAALGALLERAARAGLDVRVAVIPNSYDLGSALAAWRKPQAYAGFLGYELENSFRSALLVVMPNGLGLNWPGHAGVSVPRVTTSSGAGALVADAEAAVRALAASVGVRLGKASAPAKNAGGSLVVILVLAWVLVLAAIALLIRRRRAGPRASRVRTRRWHRPAVSRLVLAEGVALILAIAGGATLIVLKTQATGEANAASSDDPPFVFRAGSRAAPDFTLTDQRGRRVSLAAYRGKPVIITFIDPFCRNLCPLAAHVLNEVDRELPAARRVPIIAVSVDVYADTRADLHEDLSRWSLVPQWQWAVGVPAALARVWRSYAVGVQVVTKRRAGIVEHIISHDELAYVIDASGHERALYFWPYSAQAVEHTLTSLERA
jgi:cytochrome oxidase Cu insertion factor (SCO1/SenC/PrrC family)